MISRDFKIPTFNELVADLTKKVNHDHSYSLHPSLKVPEKSKFYFYNIQNKKNHSRSKESDSLSKFLKDGMNNGKHISKRNLGIKNSCLSREGNRNANKSMRQSARIRSTVDEVIDVDEYEDSYLSREGMGNAFISIRKPTRITTSVEVINVDEYENSCLSREGNHNAKVPTRKSTRKTTSVNEVINVEEERNSCSSKEQNQVDDDIGLLVQKTTEKLNKTSRNNYNLKNSLKGSHNAKESVRKSTRQAVSSKNQKEKGTSILDIIGTIDSMLDTTKKDADVESEKVDDVISEIFRDKKKYKGQNNSGSPFVQNNTTKKKNLSDIDKTIFQTHIKIVGSNIIHSCTNQKETNPVNTSSSSQIDQPSRISNTFQESPSANLEITNQEEDFEILESDASTVSITSNHDVNEDDGEADNLFEAHKLSPNQVKSKDTNMEKVETKTNEIDGEMNVMDLFRRTQLRLEELKKKNSDMKRNAKGTCSYSRFDQLNDENLTKNDDTNFSIYNSEKETNVNMSPGKQLDFEINDAVTKDDLDKVISEQGIATVENTVENRISLIESDKLENSKRDCVTNSELSKGKLDSSEPSFDRQDTESSKTNEETVYNNAEILRLYNKTQYKLNKIKKKNHIFSQQSSKTTDNEGLVGGCTRSGRKKRNINYNFNMYRNSKLNKKLAENNDDNQDSFQTYDNTDYVQKDHLSDKSIKNENEHNKSISNELDSTDQSKAMNLNHEHENELSMDIDLNAIEKFEKSSNRKLIVTRNRIKWVKNASVDDIDFSVKLLPKDKAKHNGKTTSVDEVIDVDDYVIAKQNHRKQYNMRRISDQKKSRKNASSNEVESVSPSKKRVQERIYRLKDEKDSVSSPEKVQSKIQSCKNEASARKSARISSIREMLIRRSIIPIKKDFCIKVDDCLCPSNSKKKINYFDGKVYSMRNHNNIEKSPEIELSTNFHDSENTTQINENFNFKSVLSDLDPRNLTSDMKYTNDDITDELDFLGITGMKKIKAIRWDSSNLAGNILPIKSGIVVRNITVENICKFNSIQYSKSVVYQSQFSKLFFDEVNMLLSIYPLTKSRYDSGEVRLKRKRKMDRNTESLNVTNPETNEKSDQGVPLSDSKIEEAKSQCQISLETATAELSSKPFSSITTGNNNHEQTDNIEVLQENDVLNPSVVQPSVVDDCSSNDDLPCSKKFASEYGSSPSEIIETLQVHYNSNDCYYNPNSESADLSCNLLKNYPLRKRNIISIT